MENWKYAGGVESEKRSSLFKCPFHLNNLFTFSKEVNFQHTGGNRTPKALPFMLVKHKNIYWMVIQLNERKKKMFEINFYSSEK